MESPAKAFLKMAFGPEARGYLCIAFLSIGTGTLKREMSERFFRYPDQLDEAARVVEKAKHHADVYYCPQLFEGAKRRKGNVKQCPTVWADLCTWPPEKLLITRTSLIESRPGSY